MHSHNIQVCNFKRLRDEYGCSLQEGSALRVAAQKLKILGNNSA